MEEPLLAASRKRQLTCLLCISEDLQDDQQFPPPLNSPTPSSIKELLIFGSPAAQNLLQSDFPSYSPDPFSELLLSAPFYDSNAEHVQPLLENQQLLGDAQTPSSLVLTVEGNNHQVADERYFADDGRSARLLLLQQLDSPKQPMLSKQSLKHHNEESQHYDDHRRFGDTAETLRTTDDGTKHLFRSRTAPAMFRPSNRTLSDQRSVDFNVEAPPSLGSPMSVVTQAFIGLMIYLSVGMLIYTLRGQEFSGATTNGFFDALYFCIVTMCTIGYGDITPVTPVAKLFSCAFVLVGFGFIDILLSAMVSYVLQRQETLLLNSVAAGPHETAKNYLVDIKKGRMRIRSKVFLAFGVVVMCIGVGTLMMRFLEGLGWLDSFYLSCMSVTTVGYGDHAFKTLLGRVFASVWLLVSTLAVAQSFLYLAEARIDKRHRLIAKWVLEKEMTLADLLAADLDNDGNVSKSDFVVYKLKEMRKIDEKDIVEICRQFRRLDPENTGKITLSRLLDLHKASAMKK